VIIKKIEEVPAVKVEMDGAKDVSVRVLFGPTDKAPTFAMRQFEIEKSGHTPLHTHPFEHEVVILQGQIAVVWENGETSVSPGDVVMVMPNEKHQFKNMSETEPAKMLCLVPVEYQR